MPLYTQEQLKAKIEALDVEIAKTEVAQSVSPGANVSLARGELAAKYRERERLIKEWERLEAYNNFGGTNLARFPRPS
jgi:ribosome-binding protein aMBF1 (putative translation factor)